MLLKPTYFSSYPYTRSFQMQFNIIGAGKLGKTIAHSFTTASLGILQGICNKNSDSAQKAVDVLGVGTAYAHISDLPKAELTFITTPDDTVGLVAETLAKSNHFKGRIVVHCSGVLSSEVLHALKEQGAFVASIHFPKVFRGDVLISSAFDAVDCVMEGDEEALKWLASAFIKLKAQVIRIKPTDKALYHAACVFAANYLVTLAQTAKQLMLEAGFTSDISKSILQKLMQGSLENIASNASPLTGPLSRFDIETLALHLKALENNPSLKELYQALGIATLPITTLNTSQKDTVLKLFSAEKK